jgi:Polysaccharide pyruvyl transferase
MPLKAALMNDTGRGAHFGCDRVMRVITSNLTNRGVSICARSRVGNKWWEDKSFLSAANSADLIVINGEGTCHHGRPNAEKLLRVVDHVVAANKPVVLINAMYQENPPEWRRYLDKFALIKPRDSWSAATLSELTGQRIQHLPDLSMSEGVHPDASTATRDLLTIGESVLPQTTQDLIAFADSHPQAVFLPLIATLKSTKPKYPWPLRKLRAAYANAHKLLFQLQRKNTAFSRNEFEYARSLLRSYLHVSGRFHAICFAISTETPFLALTSNAWKIEALMEDIGIDKSRIVEAASLDEMVRDPQALAFSEKERKNIESKLAHAVSGTRTLFDRIVQLAEEKHPATVARG